MTESDQTSVAHLAKISGADLNVVEECKKPHTRIWVAKAESASAVGYLLAWHIADELQIVDVATAPSARRRGVARTLLTTARDYAAQNRCALLLLEVREDNLAARALYADAGFELLRTRRDYYAGGVNALELELKL